MAKKDAENPEKQEASITSPAQMNSAEESLSDEALEEVSGGDFASGQATGKRQYKPIVVKLH